MVGLYTICFGGSETMRLILSLKHTNHVCVLQTYGNECLLNCNNIALKNKGECDNAGCFPWEESSKLLCA